MPQDLKASSPQPNAGAPLLGVMERAECEEILARNNVGRLAYTLHDHPDIVPVNFAYDDGWIYGRTAPGGKLLDIIRNRRVAFEVDEHETAFSWRSVVVHGPLYVMDPEGDAVQKQAHARALDLLRGIVPGTLEPADPVPFRTDVFRIEAAEVSGRFASPGGTRIEATQPRTRDDSADQEADSALAKEARRAVTRVSALPARIHVDAFDGVVVVSGVVDTASERNAIEKEILALPNVAALVQQLETAYPDHQQHAPAELARDALRALAAGGAPSDSGLKIVVQHDWLRAEGSVASAGHKEDALRRLRAVAGARGVVDRIKVA